MRKQFKTKIQFSRYINVTIKAKIVVSYTAYNNNSEFKFIIAARP